MLTLNPRKILVGMILVSVLITGMAFAATNQTSSAILGINSTSVSGNNINGGTSGTMTARLNVTGGTMNVEAKKVIAYWPDSTISSFICNSTSTQKLSNINMTPDENLYYIKLSQTSSTHIAGSGELRNYPY